MGARLTVCVSIDIHEREGQHVEDALEDIDRRSSSYIRRIFEDNNLRSSWLGKPWQLQLAGDELGTEDDLVNENSVLRQERGLTQIELADLVNTRQSGISRLENMDALPSLSFLSKIAEALEADIEIRLVPKR